MNRTIKLAVMLAAATMLSACGGGGGGGGSSSPSVSVSTSNLLIDEGGKASFKVNASSGVSVKVSGGTVAKVTASGGQYVVTAGQVDRPVTETLTVTATQENKGTKTLTVNVAINNTSASSLEDQVNATLNQTGDIYALTEDYNVYRAIIETMYLDSAMGTGGVAAATSPMTYAEKTTLLEDFDPTQSYYYTMLGDYLKKLDQAKTQYQHGEISDTDLSIRMKGALFAIKNHAQYGASKLAPLLQAYYPNLDLKQVNMEFSSEAGRYTRFVGNPAFGADDGNGWHFNSEFSMLNQLVPSETNSVQFCEG